MRSLALAAWAKAQDRMVYPAQGQSQEQQQKNEFECFDWAKQQSGFDPMATPQATAPPPQQQGRQASPLGGAARGAAIGGYLSIVPLNLEPVAERYRSLNAIDGHTTNRGDEQ